MTLGPVPLAQDLNAKGGATTGPWVAWFQSLFSTVGGLGKSGPTAQRPLSTPQLALGVGQPYFDTTLGVPIWVQSLNPTVWVDATGAPV